ELFTFRSSRRFCRKAAQVRIAGDLAERCSAIPKGPLRPVHSGPANGRFRRLARCPRLREGPLTEPTAGPQLVGGHPSSCPTAAEQRLTENWFGSQQAVVPLPPPLNCTQPRQFAVTIAVRSCWFCGLREGRTH